MCIPLVLLLWLLSIPFFINAAIPQPKGFLLNCGGPEFIIAENGLNFIPDHGYISVGNITSVKKPDVLPLLKTLRFFPDTASRKYCYTFPVIKGRKFLIRTTYYYGDFDGKKEPPVFDQIIEGTRWTIVNTTEDYANGLSSYYEIIVTAHRKSLSVCLARNENTVSCPFISALEVIYLKKSLYSSTDFDKYGLSMVARASFGSDEDIISYPDDAFNRDWQPFMDGNVAEKSHSNISTSGFWNIPPAKAFATAITASQAQTLTVKWPPFPLPDSIYYVAFYFQESRSPGVSVYSMEWPLKGQVEIVMNPREDMDVGPLINAGEIFQILPLGGRTVTRDVKAMEKLAKSLKNLPPDWNGDPCLPKQHSWTGVTCSEEKNTRIISLNLTSFGISGTLPKDIANLTAISSLWLGGNKLSGTIPDMSSLKALKSLHLEDNKLEGSIPQSLGVVPKLQEVFLQNNNLTGSIPNNLANKKEINLQVSGNNLSYGKE
ncbi:Leucine-rich repeat receptor-like serine/threonine-protein kinase [Heracleum sosnowskyi]|uniref:Leucine-rich repeat receptor-like serine/threonine-protein kinase n=1 Tax=Heracleum sosnowskyi TaxID=360622 RepID=A0AAD8HXY1_9APIA|nr:Leucine-rich repeat receptor-like serine/threonine-protein kinase [Heracleum sosnowskyi]